MSRNGLDRKKRCGRSRGLAAFRNVVRKGSLFFCSKALFVTIALYTGQTNLFVRSCTYLSIVQITGAIKEDAATADATSTPSRIPKLLVFRFDEWDDILSAGTIFSNGSNRDPTSLCVSCPGIFLSSPPHSLTAIGVGAFGALGVRLPDKGECSLLVEE